MKIVILLVFTFITQSILAQNQVIFQREKTETYLFKLSNDAQWVKNDIIKKIAKGNNKNENLTQFSITFTQSEKILKRTGYIDIQILLDKITFTGDIKYRGFSIEETILPSEISFQIHLKSKKIKDINKAPYKVFTKDKIKINGNPIVLANFSEIDTLNDDKYTLSVEKKEFFFNHSNQNAFDEKVKYIDSYFNSLNVVNEAITTVSAIPNDELTLSTVENFEILYDYKTLAEKKLQVARDIKNLAFMNQLKVNQNDPERLIEAINILENKCNQLLKSCNSLIVKLDVLSYNRGLDFLAKNNVQMAQFYFNKSITYNKNYAPAHFQIAKINYENQNPDEAIQILFRIDNMKPDAQIINQMADLANRIYLDYLNEAGSLNNSSKFDGALKILDKASNLCKNFKSVTCNQNLEIEYTKAFNGQYNNILAEIDKNISSDNLYQAEKLVDDAKTFQKKYSNYIQNDNEIIQKHQRIYLDYIAKGDIALSKKQYENSINFYSNALNICNQYSYISCTDQLTKGLVSARTGVYKEKITNADELLKKGNISGSENTIEQAIKYQNYHNLLADPKAELILNQVKQKIYNKFIAEGDGFSSGKEYEKALSQYHLAKDLEPKYKINIQKELDTKITGNAKALIIDKVEAGEKKANVNDLSAARNFYNEAIKIQRAYNLLTDMQIVTILNGLNDKIFNQECLNYKAQYEEKYNQAINYIFKKEYITAKRILNEAIKITETYAICQLDASNAQYKLTDIENAVVYQQKMLQISESLRKKLYQTVIDLYNDATAFFNEKQLESNYNLVHKELFTFVISDPSSDFLNHSVKYFADLNQLDNSLQLLKELQRRNYKKNSTKVNQTILGTQLAIRDKRENSSANPKVEILKYTNGNSYFKYLKNAYKKQWKR